MIQKLRKASERYKKKADYFNGISFEHLAQDFSLMSTLCDEMIDILAKTANTSEKEISDNQKKGSEGDKNENLG